MPNGDFYYTETGQRIPLRPADDTLAVAYRGAVPPKQLEQLIRGDSRLREFACTRAGMPAAAVCRLGPRCRAPAIGDSRACLRSFCAPGASGSRGTG